MLLGFFNKGRCLDGLFNERAYKDLCYNDIQPLYGIRLFADRDGDGATELTFPYLHGVRVVESNELRDGAIEYPVLTGLFMYGVAKVLSLVSDAPNGDSYLRVSVLFLAPFGMIAAYLLARMARWRALMWAAAPAVIFYAFHNWDLLAVAAAVSGFYAWTRGRTVWAAVLFGIGGALKMFPIFFLAPLFLERWFARDRRGAMVAVGGGVATFGAINLPFIIKNFDGWWATYSFHSNRIPNYDSMWCAIKQMCLEPPFWTSDGINKVSGGLTVLFFLGILVAGVFIARRTGRYPFVQACGALLATFLLFSKVHSPQYTLWLLPFFVLIGPWTYSLAAWVLYSIADGLVYYGIFRWFTEFNTSDFPASELVMLTGIWMRAALLLGLVGWFMSTSEALPPPPPPLPPAGLPAEHPPNQPEPEPLLVHA